jgi:hypothetical protein
MPLRGSVLRPSPLPDNRQANNQPDYCGGHRNDSSKMRQQAVRCREIGPANQQSRGADGERPWPAKTPKPCPARRRSGRNSAQEDQRMAGPFAFKPSEYPKRKAVSQSPHAVRPTETRTPIAHMPVSKRRRRREIMGTAYAGSQ